MWVVKIIGRYTCVNNRVTIDGLVRIEIKFGEICKVTLFFSVFFFFFCKAIFLSCLHLLCIRLMYECVFLGLSKTCVPYIRK